MIHNMSIFKMFSVVLMVFSSSMLVSLFWMFSSKQFLIIDWEMFETGGVTFVYSILLDWMSAMFLSVVFLISSSVMFYSDEYMSHEKSKNSFAMIVFLFVLSMMFLIISPNFISVILGWDGLGLVSYLLVIYYQNYKSYSAGMLTCLTNRLGDSALLVAMGWAVGLGSMDWIYMLSLSSFELKIMGIFVVLAAVTKSAQVPFSSWLPAAMAAPTPVSALVHSSTLVTAGVYLVIRFYPMLAISLIMNILFFMGLMTMIMSSIGAMYEMDLKKIIALSTLSQLGLMMMSLGAGYYLLAFFHLLTHALFKASLFLCAGSVIHSYGGSQDLRELNSVVSIMPLTSSCLSICSLSLIGFPFLSAFYSKDKIIEESLSDGGNMVWLVLFILSVAMTSIYSFRLVYYISFSPRKMKYESASDSLIMTKSMLLLTSGGVMGGSGMSWVLFDGVYDNLFIFLKLMVIVMLGFGVMLGLIIGFNKMFLFSFYSSMMWFLVSVGTKMLPLFGLIYGKALMKTWDSGWNESLGPKGVSEELFSVSNTSGFTSGLPYKMLMMLVFCSMGLIVLIL